MIFTLLMVAHYSIEIPWQKGSTYNIICQKYTDYVIQHYRRAHVVFDGYNSGPSTKDNAHLRRTREQMTEVHFTGSTKMNVKKDLFLSNKKNKLSFFFLLSRTLEQIGCQVSHFRGDADMLIVQTAVQSATQCLLVMILIY